MAIKSYTSVAASNISLFPENMAPSAVNDNMRQVQADIRNWYVDAEWADHGDVPSRASGTTFKVATDVTAKYATGRRLKFYDGSTLYGTVVSSSYSAPDTTITVTTDSGALTSSLSSVALSILSPTNQSLPSFANTTVAGTLSVSGAAVFKTTATIEGAVTISGAATFNTTVTVSGNAVFKTGVTVDGTLVEIKGNATNAARIRLYEDTDNGSNYIEQIATSSIASNRTVTWPDTDVSNFVVQRVSTQTGAVATGTTTIPADDTIPQNTEGDQYMSLAITPKNTANILVIDVTFCGSTSSANGSVLTAALFQDTTANALACNSLVSALTTSLNTNHFRYTMSAGTTSSTTFKVRAGSNNGGTTTFNGQSGGRIFGGVWTSSITITEYAA
jgi:cytoskeletal protein CcmA (bactofilin family)